MFRGLGMSNVWGLGFRFRGLGMSGCWRVEAFMGLGLTGFGGSRGHLFPSAAL